MSSFERSSAWPLSLAAAIMAFATPISFEATCRISCKVKKGSASLASTSRWTKPSIRLTSSRTRSFRSSSLAGARLGAMPACMKIEPAYSVTIGLPRSQAPYWPARADRLAVFDVTRRVDRKPRVTSLLIHRRDRFAFRRLRGCKLRVLLPRCLASRFRLRIREGGEDLRRDVSRLADEVHRLVIAEHRDDASAGVLRLPLERHQQVEHGSRARAAVHVVAGLHQDGFAAGPAAAVIGEPGGLQDALEFGDGAVNVADRDEARRTLAMERLLSGRPGEERGPSPFPPPSMWRRLAFS